MTISNIFLRMLPAMAQTRNSVKRRQSAAVMTWNQEVEVKVQIQLLVVLKLESWLLLRRFVLGLYWPRYINKIVLLYAE